MLHGRNVCRMIVFCWTVALMGTDKLNAGGNFVKPTGFCLIQEEIKMLPKPTILWKLG